MESFCCLTAARLLIDHQLRGTGAIPSELQRIVEDATLIAFDQIIDLALDHDVDCLLISGKVFDPDDRSLRGPAALVQGIARLADRDVAIVFHPSQSEIWSQWPSGLRFPPNVHRLGAGLETSVSITREGRLIANVTDDDTGWKVLLPGHSESLPLSSGPRPVQGMAPDETGPHGVSLVDWDGTNSPQQTFVPMAPVRWERFAIAVTAEMTRDDLLQEMASRMEEIRRNDCERLWLVSWDVSGAGPLIESLAHREYGDELLADLIQLEPVPGIHLHCPRLQVHSAASADWPSSSHDDPAADFASRLESRFAEPAGALRESLGAGPWEVRIDSLLGELDAGELAHDARRMAMHWFAAQEELSS